MKHNYNLKLADFKDRSYVIHYGYNLTYLDFLHCFAELFSRKYLGLVVGQWLELVDEPVRRFIPELVMTILLTVAFISLPFTFWIFATVFWHCSFKPSKRKNSNYEDDL